MQILIVDDEQMAVQGISMALNWQELGIDKVWTAMSIGEARNIIMEEKIDFLLCDIEMRNENGLHLVDWVNKNYKDLVCMIVTGHVNFEYTRKAVELQVLAYLSKPLDERRLKNTIKKAIQYRTKTLNINENELQNRIYMENQFFGFLLQRVSKMSGETLKEEMDKRHITMHVNERYMLMLIKIRTWNEEYDEEEREKINFSMTTYLSQEILKGIHVYSSRMAVDEVYFGFESTPKEDMKTINEKLKKFIAYCEIYFRCSVCVYVHKDVELGKMGKNVQNIKKADEDNVSYDKGVFWPEEQKKQQGCMFQYPDLKMWKMLLINAAYDDLKKEITEYMKSDYVSHNVNRERLNHMILDFENILRSVASAKEENMGELLENQRIMTLRKNAVSSIEICSRWMIECIGGLQKLNDDEPEEDVVTTICTYIDRNIENEISRNELADIVYMSPDHMTRIFKRKMGMTISEYLLQKKLEKSAYLLEKTRFSISYVATSVGYSNISHFSGAFRKQYGISPSEYRKLNCKISD